MHRRFLASSLRSPAAVAVLAVGAFCTASAPASAATLYWSGNGSTQGGSGVWNTTLTRFGTTTSSFPVAWSNTTNAADTALFGGATVSSTIGTTITVRSITFNVATTLASSSSAYSLTTGTTTSLTLQSGSGKIGTVSAAISGSSGITVAGLSGTVALSGSSSYTGVTSITGNLQLSNNGNIASSSGISGGGSLIINRSQSSTQGIHYPLISGSCDVSTAGSGVTIFTFANTYTGPTAVTSGTLQMGNGGTTGSLAGSSSIAVSSNARFAVNRSDNVVQTSSFKTISGAGSVSNDGSGTTIFTAANTYSGTTFVTAGSVQMGNSGTTGSLANSSSILVSTSAAFAVNRSDSVTQGTHFKTISGSGGFTQAGTGATTLTAPNAYTGPTAVSNGTLRVNGDQLAASGPVTVAAGATLAGTGTVGGATTIQSGAMLSPGTGPGTLSFTQGLTFAAGGNYTWQMLSGTGVAGEATAWDLASVTGGLSIDATSTTPFRLNLWTLSSTAPDVSGSAANFNPAQNYSWRIATAAGGISGFSSDKFVISTSATNGAGGFANGLAGGTFSLAQSGNDLNLVFTAAGPGAITINVASGTQTQTQAGYAILAGGNPLVKTGGGTLVLDQANTLTGSTTVQGGRLQVANGSALGASRIVPLAGGTVTLSPALQTTVGGLAPNAGGLVDVGTGMITVSAGLSAADMLIALGTGLGDGSWNGTSGITSSEAAASGGNRTVGWLDNGDGTVTFAFAAAGDTNLDWQVDILDASNFLAGGKLDSGTLASWNEGDFTYDGLVDILDAASFLSTGLFDSGAYNTAAGRADAVAAVPEPASLAGAAVGFLAGLRLRRRS
ncbi:MAG: beta strand repeat-containing protein [Planctomycetaceae bacterium]